MFITIIMPVYNAANTLNRSVNSVLNQVDADWELICVDDGSKDNSLEILKSFAEGDSRIKVFHKENSGPGLTRNYAIERASGDYIGFLDADDRWHPNCVTELKKAVQMNNSDVIFLATRYCSQTKEWDAYHPGAFSSLPKDEVISCMMSGILPWGQEKVIRASIIRENKLLYSDDPIGEEAIFSFDALNRSKTISFINSPMYYYHVNANSQHTLGNLDPWQTIVVKMKNHLISIGEYEKFETSVNSLAIRAMTIAVYRCFLRTTYRNGVLNAKKAISFYSKEFSIKKYNKVSLDRTSKVILLFIKLKLFYVLYVLSCYRNRRGQS